MKRIVWLGLLIALLVAGCQEAEEVVLVETVVPTMTQTLVPSTAIVTATSAPTQEPTPTITRTPRPVEVTAGDPVVKQGTALPEVEPITLENLDRLQLLAQWGYGRLYDVQLTADETQVVAATATGFYWFDAITLEVVEVVPYAFEADYSTIQLSPTTKVATFIGDKYRTLHYVDTATGEVLCAVENSGSGDICTSLDGNRVYDLDVDLAWYGFEQEWRDWGIDEYEEIDYSADGEMVLVRLPSWELYLYTAGKEEPEQITVFDSIMWDEFDLSDDGRYIAVGGAEDVNVKVWDTVEETMIFERCLDEYGCFEFTEGSASGGKLARENLLSGPSSGVVDLAITANGKYLIVYAIEDYGFERYLYRFNLESNMLIMKEELIEGGGGLLPFSNSRRYITWNTGTIQSRFIYESGVQAYIKNDNAIELPAEEPFGTYTDYDGVFHIVDNLTGEDIRQKHLDYDYSRLVFFNHSPIIVFGNRNYEEQPFLWNYETDEIFSFPVTGWEYYVNILEVSSDDQLIHYCIWEAPCYLVDAATLEMLEMSWKDMSFDPAGSRMIYWDEEEENHVVASYEGLMFTPEIVLYGCMAYGRPYFDDITVGFLSDGAGYYCISEERLRIYTAEGTFTDFPISHGGDWTDAHPVGFLDDNSLYITYQVDDLKFFDLTLGRFVTILKTPSEISEVKLIADGAYILTRDFDDVYRLWGVPTGD